uniref:Agenet domain-containing protein n=1 Tax=Hydatigena taeniaeformis TaxID=6205 RepID=A0A0R3XD33_HYDTA
LRGTDSSMVRVGWKFTSRGSALPNGSTIASDKPWDLLASERLCHPEESHQCEADDDVLAEGSTTVERVEGSWSLDSMLHEATGRIWKARWLRVTPETTFGSGTWQCWIEGPDLFENKSIGERRSKDSPTPEAEHQIN